MSARPGRGPDPTVERRIAAWRRTGDLSRLWPDVEPEEWRTAHRMVRSTTQEVLDPAGALPSLRAPDARARRALGVAAFTSGMGPLLAWWIAEGHVVASRGAHDVLAPHLDHGRRRIASLRERLSEVVGALRAEDVDPVVLKGLHTGAVYFPDPTTRPAADIDLLVAPDQRPTAAHVLAAAGFTERRTRFADRSEWTPAGDRATVHSLEMEHADDPWSVDLHTSLDRWYFRGLRRGLGAPPFDRAVDVPMDGETVRGLPQPHLTAFLALHASYELVKVRLVRVVELVLVIRRDVGVGRLDWSELAGLVEGTGTGRFVHPALALAEHLAPGTVAPDLLERTGRRVSARARRVLGAVRDADVAPLLHRSLDAKLMWARGPRELLLNLSELVYPSDEGLDVGPVRLAVRRIQALLTGRAGWRARPRDDTMGA